MRVENLTLTNFNNREYQVHTYVLEPNPELVEQKRPLAIVVPGGSFNHLSKREGEPVALAFNNQGFNSVVMEYNLVQDPDKIYPDAGLDVLSTVKYFRDHADEYQLDKDKILTVGFSAGGHVVSVANNMALNKNYQTKYDFDKTDALPNKTILGYPLIDIKKIGFPIPEDQKAKMPVEEDILDSALGVTRETPDTFIFQAWDDPVVLIGNSIEYIGVLNKNKVSAEAHLFNYGYHGFSLARHNVETKGQDWQDNPHAAHWFNLAMERVSGANDVKHKKSSNPNDNIYHTIVKNRKIDRMIMPFEAVYCVWLIITLVLNFKLFAYSIDAQFVLISLFFISGWVSSLVKNHCMKKSRK